MSHRDSPIKKNKELKKPMDIMNVGFVGAAGGDGIVGDGIGEGWVELGRTTLGSDATSVTISGLSYKKYYHILFDGTFSTGNTDNILKFNNNSSSYCRRHIDNGAGYVTQTGRSSIGISTTLSPEFLSMYVANRTTTDNDKLVINRTVGSSSGASSTVQRLEMSSAWENDAAVSSIQISNNSTGSFNAGAEIVVLGHSYDDSHEEDFWTPLVEYESTSASSSLSTGSFTPTKYLWFQAYVKPTGGSIRPDWRVGNGSVDSGANYSTRYRHNMTGSDTTNTSETKVTYLSAKSVPYFIDGFILNNSSKEKLIMATTMSAESTPVKTKMVAKWVNTSDQINVIDIINSGGTGQYDSGSLLRVWGSD